MKLHRTSCSTRTRITFTDSDGSKPPSVWVVFSKRRNQWVVRVEDKNAGVKSVGLTTLSGKPTEDDAVHEYLNAV